MRKKRSSLTLVILIIVGMVGMVFTPTMEDNAFAWGVMGPFKTHQHILNEAYKLLQADPAFDPLKFPSLEPVLLHEGVNPLEIKFTGEGTTGLDASIIAGPGPDSKGNSPYSWHYYNPYTKEGRGPEAVQRYYRYLVQGMLKSQNEVLAKSAAWSAHFLADMHCPYHVNGSYRDTIVAIRTKQLAENQGTLSQGGVYLDDAIKGSVKLRYLMVTPIKSLSDNFRTEIDRFLETENDWFDPWYYNGDYFNALISNTSSHILWEATVNPGDYDLQGYAPGWLNAEGTIDKIVAAQEHQAYNLAVKAALRTREQIDGLFDYPAPAVNEAIRSVYSMWRASFSAMRLDIDVKKDGDFLVATGRITNRGGGALQRVEARLSSTKCEIVSDNKSQKLGGLQAGEKVSTRAWRIKAGAEPCQLTMDAVCRSSVPDLQYASVQHTLTPALTLKIAPDKVRLTKKERQTFRALLQGKETTDVTWRVREGAGSGSITETGVYTPGASGGTATIVAIGKSDTKLQAEAAVTISGISLDSATFNTAPGDPIALTLTVTNPPEKPRYEWNYGDGSAAATTDAKTATHAYANRGAYRLTVKMIDGASGAVIDEATADVRVEAVLPPAEGRPTQRAFAPVYADSFAVPAIPEGCKVKWNQGQQANDAVFESERLKHPEKYPDYYAFHFRLNCPKTLLMETGSLTVPYRAKPLEYKVESYYPHDESPCLEVRLKYMPGHGQADLIKEVEEFADNMRKSAANSKTSEGVKSFTFPGWNASGSIQEDKRGGFTFVGLGENKTLVTISHFSPIVQFMARDGGFFPNQQCMNNGRYCTDPERKIADDFEREEKNKRIVKHQEQLKKRAVEFLSGMRLKGW